MRIESTLKKLWKQIEANIRENQAPARRPAAVRRPSDTFTAARTQPRSLVDNQQPLRGAPAPKFDAGKSTRIVEGLYQALLGRSPDPVGLEAWVPLVQQGRLAEVIDGIAFSDELKERAPSLELKALASSLYEGILGRQPDPEGDLATQTAIGTGGLAARIYDMVLSPEMQQRLALPVETKVTPAPPATPTPQPPTTPPPTLPPEPGAPLATVPMRPEYAAVKVDRNNPEKAILEAATWVRENKPQYFHDDDRNRDMEMMAWVIGILRANGHDAHRVVNHPSLPQNNGFRYGSDALVLNNQVYDVYASHGGGGSRPQLLHHGDYTAPGKHRE